MSPPDASTGVACSVSGAGSISYASVQKCLSTEINIGTGEQIIRAGLARSLVESIYAAPDNAHEILQQTLEQFCGAHPQSVICVE